MITIIANFLFILFYLWFPIFFIILSYWIVHCFVFFDPISFLPSWIRCEILGWTICFTISTSECAYCLWSPSFWWKRTKNLDSNNERTNWSIMNHRQYKWAKVMGYFGIENVSEVLCIPARCTNEILVIVLKGYREQCNIQKCLELFANNLCIYVNWIKSRQYNFHSIHKLEMGIILLKLNPTHIILRNLCL